MIFGLEHFSLKNICYNLAITLLPFEFRGRKEVLVIPRVKNHYSPSEIREIEGNWKQIPTKDFSTYHLYSNTSFGLVFQMVRLKFQDSTMNGVISYLLEMLKHLHY